MRRWAALVQRTPLHPQWFAFVGERSWLAQVGASCGGLVLDIGCGHQRVRPFVPAACRYVGFDYYKTASAMYGTRPDVYSDAAALPVPDGAADTVLLLEVLEHLPDAERALREAARVMSPAATLVISVPFLYPLHDAPYDFQRWTPRGLAAALERQGLIVASSQTIGTPFETAALIANIALAQASLRLVSRWPLTALLAVPLLGILVLPINLLGWLLGRIDRDHERMPFGCRVWCRKTPPTGVRDKVKP